MFDRRTRSKTKRQRHQVPQDAEYSEQLYGALIAGVVWFLQVPDMVQLLGTCRLLRQDRQLSVLALSNCNLGMHLLSGCNWDWMDVQLRTQENTHEDESSCFWSTCQDHKPNQELNRRLLDDNHVALNFSIGQGAQMLSLIGQMTTYFKALYAPVYVSSRFGEYCRVRPVIVPLPTQNNGRRTVTDTKKWTVTDVRYGLNALGKGLGDDFVAASSDYMHVSEVGIHWENITVEDNQTGPDCRFCTGAKNAVRAYRKQARAFMEEFERVWKRKSVEWRAQGLDEDEIYERRSDLKAEMFPEDTYPDVNAAQSTVDDILAHICEQDKFPVVPFEGMAMELERKEDDIFNALADECQELCRTLYQPLKWRLSAAVTVRGQRVYRKWMDTNDGGVRRELIAGVTGNGFLFGVYVMKTMKDEENP